MSEAWVCHNEESCIAEVVFADTRGKAKSYFKNLETFDYYTYCELRLRRLKKLDYLNHHDGYVMDLNNEEDRIAMVKDISFYCAFPDKEECNECCAKKWCDVYQEYEE